MDARTLAWIAFGLYVVATSWLALRGMKKTRDFAGFALGNRDMGPLLVGITLAAATASTATFVINPGFVYVHGVSALLHFGVASVLGVTVGLVVLSKGFRKHGNESGALTLPHWIGARFQHGGMRTYFALLNLALAISFVVLIIKGSALVMQHTLGLGYVTSVVIIVGFVFSYILMGGTYAHAYTNAFQGALMILVALAIVGSGLWLLGDGVGPFLDRIAAQDPNLVAPINPESALFGSAWEVFVCGFVVSFGLVCQPHILTKALYLKNDRDLNRYLVVAAGVGLVFAAILIAGLWARATNPAIASQDTVMALYIQSAFSPLVGVLISVALLAAGMSTMDGILVSASTIAGNDLLLGSVGERFLGNRTPAERQALAFRVSRFILIAMGVVSFLIALDPPELVGLFAQAGIYALVAASVAPVAFGIFVERLSSQHVFAAALIGPIVHFAHYGWVVWIGGGFLNPAVSATEGVLASVGLLTGLTLLSRARAARRVARLV
jgi:SSS family solute:Na+ symporter/sodium/pantothenate symporter